MCGQLRSAELKYETAGYCQFTASCYPPQLGNNSQFQFHNLATTLKIKRMVHSPIGDFICFELCF